jgi:putative peptide zinc metalloprotease protein
VTEATEWIVTGDQVGHLVETKLTPLGLIAGAAGSDTSGAGGGRRTASPLGLHTRVAVVGPRVLEPVVGVLRWLYAPAALVPMLLLIAIAHAWLYGIHGVEGSLRSVLGTPGLILVALGMTVLAGLFHELGHAAGLRYGGGRVREMGVGFFLFYPAFYTDVTDSYRLGRWARVRTDLGGLYFHLIFAVAVMGVYAFVRQEYLLVVVLLINLEVLYQCLPFARLDGYWAIADLAGIPDLFSQIGPFLRSLVPIGRATGTGLPRLKPWVRAVFAGYIVVTLPMLGLLVLLVVSRMPGVLALGWRSLVSRAQLFSVAQTRNDVLLMVGAALEIALLGLSMLAALYLAANLVWTSLDAIRRATRHALRFKGGNRVTTSLTGSPRPPARRPAVAPPWCPGPGCRTGGGQEGP